MQVVSCWLRVILDGFWWFAVLVVFVFIAKVLAGLRSCFKNLELYGPFLQTSFSCLKEETIPGDILLVTRIKGAVTLGVAKVFIFVSE